MRYPVQNAAAEKRRRFLIGDCLPCAVCVAQGRKLHPTSASYTLNYQAQRFCS